MSKNSKQGRNSIRTSNQEARTVIDRADHAERALNRALSHHYCTVGAELDHSDGGWISYLEGVDNVYGIEDVIQSSLGRLTGSPECERDTVAAELALEIWAIDCENDIWVSTFEEEMFLLAERYQIPLKQCCW